MASKQKILIVDDDVNIAELISLYLNKECYDTQIAYDGEEALETALDGEDAETEAELAQAGAEPVE